MKTLRASGLVLLAWFAYSPMVAFADGHMREFKSAIRKQYNLKERAFRENKPDLIVEQFYAPDVFSVDNEGHAHVGREGIRPLYNEVVPTSTVRIESFRSHVDGNAGWDWANFYVKPDDPAAEPFSFVILFLWERREGRWWCVGDMFVVGEYAAGAERH